MGNGTLGQKQGFAPELVGTVYFLINANICLKCKCNALNALRQCLVHVIKHYYVACKSHQRTHGSYRKSENLLAA